MTTISHFAIPRNVRIISWKYLSHGIEKQGLSLSLTTPNLKPGKGLNR